MKTLVLSVFLFTSVAFAADCNAPVVDNANVLQGKIPQITAALASLTSKGADPRVITDDPDNVTPEGYVNSAKNACPSWQSAGGGVKNNLIVFLVFPKHRKVGLFTGQEFGKALNTSAIRSQFMAPGFKDGDYARGFISGINQAAVEIEAFQTSALHPATTSTVVNQQATDMSGLWHVLGWALLVGVLFALVWLIFFIRRRRSERKSAQQNAVFWRNEAATKVNASGGGIASEEFARLSNSETSNPDTEGLTVEQYNDIAERYKAICAGLRKQGDLNSGNVASIGRKSKTHHHDHAYSRAANEDASSQPMAQPTAYQPTPQTVAQTTIINESPFMPIPVVVEDPVPVYEHHHHHDDDDSGSSSFSSSSSSSWSDSSSSSSYDSGSSSSWSDSSSSSDFGGGGGSDFGGGSSDF